VEVKQESDTVPFHPYYTAKDGFGLGLFLILYCALVFFAPNLLGHPDNYIPANPLSTPAHIVPEWYFWPFYAILRAFTVGLPCSSRPSSWAFWRCSARSWCGSSCPGSTRVRCARATIVPLFRKFFYLLVVDVLVLGYCGGAPAAGALRDDLADRFALLLPALPRHPADRVVDRNAAAAAILNYRGGTGQG